MKVNIENWPEDPTQDRVIDVKIEPWDVYNLDLTLAEVILPGLKAYREQEMLSHTCLGKVVPDDCDGCDCAKVWEDILDEMIFAFENIVDDSWQKQFYSGEADWQLLPVKETIEGVDQEFFHQIEGPNHTLKFDKEGHDKYDARIQKGLDLFAKYFRGLWT